MSTEYKALHFIEEIIEEDLKNGKHGGRIHTRFPPEPNGFLHIGHAKAIWINFTMAQKYGGKTNLRFDDTNPSTEETAYVNAIREDIKWLGYDWEDREYYASDYFEQLYLFAEDLIKKDLAYVDFSSPDEIAQQKGTPAQAGTPNQYRSTTADENLILFRKMRAGEFEDGACVLRAKVDLASPNMLMRDPILYRIKHEAHHRTGEAWCIYPMYDFAHGQSDSLEEITHSLCSLEFIHHRPLYNWFIEKLGIFPSRQIEFARMNVAYMITSKRKLLKLVNDGYVKSWDDPRMPTISGMRRRGIPARALINFCEKTGVAKRDNLIEYELFESCIREELNSIAIRVMVVKDPIRLTITNWTVGETLLLRAENNPEAPESGERDIPFTGSLWIEREDFMEEAPKGYFRLAPGKDVRLKHAFILNCTGCIKDEEGNVTEVLATYYPNSRSGADESGIKAKGTIHWASVDHAVDVMLHEYDRLFTDPTPADHEEEGKDVFDFVNPDSLSIIRNAKAEPSVALAGEETHFQFFRLGYYKMDKDSVGQNIIFNKTIGLKDSWAKTQQKS